MCAQIALHIVVMNAVDVIDTQYGDAGDVDQRSVHTAVLEGIIYLATNLIVLYAIASQKHLIFLNYARIAQVHQLK